MLGPGRYGKKIRVLFSEGHSPVAGMELDSAKVLLKKGLGSCQLSSDSNKNRKMPDWEKNKQKKKK